MKVNIDITKSNNEISLIADIISRGMNITSQSPNDQFAIVDAIYAMIDQQIDNYERQQASIDVEVRVVARRAERQARIDARDAATPS